MRKIIGVEMIFQGRVSWYFVVKSTTFLEEGRILVVLEKGGKCVVMVFRVVFGE